MYCPNCKAEYREGFTHCRSCDTELVEGTPAAEEAEPKPARERRGPIRSLSANIDKWLKVGGIIVVLVGIAQAVLRMIPSAPSGSLGTDMLSMLQALTSLPSTLLTGFGYFALGEVISLLRKAGEQGR